MMENTIDDDLLPGCNCALKKPGAWSDNRERRFGELLGYEGWQIDYWLTHRPSPADA